MSARTEQPSSVATRRQLRANIKACEREERDAARAIEKVEQAAAQRAIAEMLRLVSPAYENHPGHGSAWTRGQYDRGLATRQTRIENRGIGANNAMRLA